MTFSKIKLTEPAGERSENLVQAFTDAADDVEITARMGFSDSGIPAIVIGIGDDLFGFTVIEARALVHSMIAVAQLRGIMSDHERHEMMGLARMIASAADQSSQTFGQ